MEISRHGILAASNHFILEEHQDIIKLSQGTIMKRTVVGIPAMYLCCWNISCCNKLSKPIIASIHFNTQVMKYEMIKL